MNGTEDLTFDRLAAPYDQGMAPLERLWLRQFRSQLLPFASGRVLEIGVGTGANLPFYPPAVHLTAIDESAEMLGVAAQRIVREIQVPGRHLVQMNAEVLAFADGTFDTLVGSLVLCSVVDQSRTLAEMRRVLRTPGGRLLLMEHMRPQARPLAWLVDLANLPWHAWNGRCHLNRETQRAVAGAGFEIERVESKAGGFFRLIVAHTTGP